MIWLHLSSDATSVCPCSFLSITLGGYFKTPAVYLQFILHLRLTSTRGQSSMFPSALWQMKASDSCSLLDKLRWAHLLAAGLPQSHTHFHINQSTFNMPTLKQANFSRSWRKVRSRSSRSMDWLAHQMPKLFTRFGLNSRTRLLTLRRYL